jgi:hypothetical protein
MLDGEPARMQAVQQAIRTHPVAGEARQELYTAQSMIDADPGFWKPKPAPKPVEKKAAQ